MKINQTSGYSQRTAKKFITRGVPIKFVGPELEPKFKWEDGKRTNKIEAYETWFIQEGLPPFQVKFSKQVELPDYESIVEFDNLQACEVRNNVYFKADGMKVVK